MTEDTTATFLRDLGNNSGHCRRRERHVAEALASINERLEHGLKLDEFNQITEVAAVDENVQRRITDPVEKRRRI